MKVKVGDVVRWAHPALNEDERLYGLIIELIEGIEVPEVARVMWAPGTIAKEWTDELETVSCKPHKD